MRLLALLELVTWDPSMLADWTVKFTSPKLSGLSLKPTLIQVKFEMTDCIKYNFFSLFVDRSAEASWKQERRLNTWFGDLKLSSKFSS